MCKNATGDGIEPMSVTASVSVEEATTGVVILEGSALWPKFLRQSVFDLERSRLSATTGAVDGVLVGGLIINAFYDIYFATIWPY